MHIRGVSAIRRPLIVLAVCAVGCIGYFARDFLVPTAGAVVLALVLTPVANTLERIRLPPGVAAGKKAAAPAPDNNNDDEEEEVDEEEEDDD